jgi:hypothetical protein
MTRASSQARSSWWLSISPLQTTITPLTSTSG